MKNLYTLIIGICIVLCGFSIQTAYSAPLTVSINPTDSVLYVCQNNELILQAIPSNGQAPYSYNWTGDVVWLNQINTSSVSFVCSIPGTYKLKVTVTDNLSATNSDSVKIIVKPLPNLTTSGNADICQGTSANMSASGPATIIWFDSSDNLIGWGASYSATPSSSTFYTVMGISNGCSVSEIINITVIPAPQAFAGNDDTICEGESFSLANATASEYNTIEWVTSGDGTFSDPDILNPTYFPGTADIAAGSVDLILSLTANAPCSDASDVLKLTINPLPILTVSNDTSVCAGNIATLYVSGAATYTWSTGETTAGISVTPATSTTYSVTGTSSGCSSSADIFVDVVPYPVLTVSNDTSVCENTSVTLNVSGATTYLWSTGAVVSSVNVTPGITTTYTVTGYNGDCSSSADIVVTVMPFPVNAGVDQTICEGTTATLTVSGGTSWIWSTGETTQTITVSPATTTAYQVTATDGICSNTDEVKVYIIPSPSVDAGADVSICPGSPAHLIASGADSYVWSTGENTADIFVSPSITTTYYLTGTQSGCTAIDSVKVTVKDSIIANAGPDVIVCTGNSVVLTASGGSSYLWNTGETTPSITVSPLATTTYSVIVGNYGCTGMDSVMVNVASLPLADAGANDSICQGGSALLNASGGDDYLWSTGETTSGINVSPASTTMYYVTVSDGICTAKDSVLLTVIDIPVVNLGNDTLVCIGSEITLTAGGGTSYLWSTGCIAGSIIEYPIDTTTYSVTVTYYGCSASDTITINTLPAINITISESRTICIGSSTVLTAGGGGDYLWSTGETTSSIIVSPTEDTSYSVTVTSGSCYTWANVDVFVQTSIPPANAGTDATICNGDYATLSASGGTIYSWNTGDTLSTITVNPSDTTVYYVTVSDGICSATDSVTVNVNQLPVLALDTAIWICPGTIASISAGGADSYVWNTGETTADIYVTPDASTIYSVTGTSSGCSASASIPVNLFNLPMVDAGDDATLCYGQSIVLHGSGDGDLVWDNGEMNDTLLVTPDSNVSVILYVYDINGCINADTVNIFVNALPSINAGNDTIICEGTNVPLWVNGGVTYLWNTTETTDSIWVSPVASRIFFVTGTDANGCSNVDSVEVSVLPIPVAFAGNDTIACGGSTVTLTGNGGGLYQWNTGETTASIVVHPVLTSNYILTVSNGVCSDTDTITVNALPIPGLNAGNPVSILEGDSVTLDASLFSGYSINEVHWTPSAWVENEAEVDATVYPDTSMMFYLSITDINGCMGIDSVFVNVFPYGIYLAPGTDTTICSGSEVLLQAHILMGGRAPFTYTWSSGTILSISDSSDFVVNPVTTTVYTLLVSDVDGYTATETYTVYTIKTPVIEIPDTISVCSGEQVEIISNSVGDHLWSGGVTGHEFNFIPTDTVNIYLSVDNLGCKAFDSTLVIVRPLPELSVSDPATACAGDSVILTANSNGQILWATGWAGNELTIIAGQSAVYPVNATLNGCEVSDTLSVTVFPIPQINISSNTWNDEFVDGQIIEIDVTPHEYQYYSLYYGNDMYGNDNGVFNLHPPFNSDSIRVEVVSGGGCKADTVWHIALRKIPNGFTPNNDGINDVFMPGTELTIVNRWGQEVFSGHDGWDGTVNGEKATPGTYYYIIVIRDEFGNVLDRINGDVLVIKQN